MAEFVQHFAFGVVYGGTGLVIVGVAVWLIDAALRGRK